MSPRRPSARPRPRPLRLAVTIALASTLVGCAASTDDAAPAAETLTIATTYAIDDLDPIANGYWGPEFGYAELLLRAEADGTTTPWVLSDLEPVDGTTWRLTLADGVRFQNGRDFDAEALASLLQWTATNSVGFAEASSFASAEATGDLEVTLTTTEPAPTMANVLADESNVVIVDHEAFEELAADGDLSDLVGAGLYTGPYAVTSLDAQRAELEADEEHWGGEPALDGVSIRFVPEASARAQAVEAGEVDLALYMPSSMAQTLEGRDDVAFIAGEPAGLVFSLISRVTSPVMQDAAVRRAIFAATDYRALAEDVLHGVAGVAEGVFPDGYPYAVQTQETDVALATELLDEAGWTVGADGVRARGDERLVVRILCTQAMPDGIAIAEAMQGQLAEIGIDVEIVQVDDIGDARLSDGWDVSLSSSLLSFGGAPDQATAELLTTGGSNNYSGIADPTLDELVATLSTTLDDARRTELLVEIQELIAEQGYYAVAVDRVSTIVASAHWAGYVPGPRNLWIDADTAPGT